MSPIDYIKEGILEGNWETVCEGYERLTGEALKLPTDRPGEVRQAKEALSQIMSIASSVFGESTVKIDETIIKDVKKKPGRPKNNKKKTAKKLSTVTKEGEDSSLKLNDNDKTFTKRDAGKVHLITNEPDPEEVKKNKIKAAKSNRNKLQINREKSNTYEVKCNECRSMFTSTRPEGEMGQKCKKCLSGLKSRFV